MTKVVDILTQNDVDTILRDLYYAMHLTGYANVLELHKKLSNAYHTKGERGKGWKLYVND